MEQLTAVEWLIEEWSSLKSQLPPWLIEKVIKMEKEQIIDAYIEGYSAPENLGDSEQYYNETYKKD